MLFLLAAMAAACAFAADAPSQEAPDELVKRVTQEVMETARTDKEIKAGNRARILQVVEQKILPHIDLERAVSLAVGRHWREATPRQRQQLTDEFRTMLIRTYAGALSLVGDQQLVYKPLRAAPGDTEVEVRFEVRQLRGREPVQVSYRLYKALSGWKVYDVNVLGVWLVETYKSSFSTEIAQGGIDGLIRTLSDKNKELAARSADLDRSLVKLPDTLRAANTTLVNVRATLADLRPAIQDAKPAAPLLSALLERLSPVARQAIPIVARTQRAVNRRNSDVDLLGIVRGFGPLAKVAVPAFDSLHGTLTDALPVVREARPYTPDVIGGLVNGFGGTTAGYYDANGHYARISFQGGPYSLNNAASPASPPSSSKDGLTGFRRGVTARCPGAATQPATDKSNPYRTSDLHCKEEDTPR